ncbi:hypothetical protein LAZ67_1001180 [Cordylochernes scorpioides]|uniref:Transposase n=1 Tax=Cordylochernes scorpioides TaxID=51811 RepID=A0ABY6JV80_9ARAC|nr:hypothetical protein LAZ67_1001180 [Cordylochernes scorpioides]
MKVNLKDIKSLISLTGVDNKFEAQIESSKILFTVLSQADHRNALYQEDGPILCNDMLYIEKKTKRQSTLWCSSKSPPPKKFAELEVLENKWSFFFRKSGFIDILIVTGIQQNAFQQYLKKIKQSRPRVQLKGVLLRHDNTRPHTSAQTLDFLTNSGVQLLTHPPYSPDLAPCDFFFLFAKVKLVEKDKIWH